MVDSDWGSQKSGTLIQNLLENEQSVSIEFQEERKEENFNIFQNELQNTDLMLQKATSAKFDNRIDIPTMKNRYSEGNQLQYTSFKQKWALYQISQMGLDHNKAQLILMQTEIDIQNLEKEKILNRIIELYFTFEPEQQQRRNQNQNRYTNPNQVIQIFSRMGSNQYLANQSNYNFKYEEEKKVQDGKECQICLCEYEEENMLKVPICGCQYCVNCINFHIQATIDEGKVLNIRCPNEQCQKELNDGNINNLLLQQQKNYQLHERFQIIKKNTLLAQDPNIRWCTRPNCETYIKGNPEERMLTCPKCQQEVCFQCSGPWHEGKCDDNVDKLFKKACKQYEIKNCPRCKSPIEKSSGCNHMTCQKCEYNFCWLCLSKYTYNHFGGGNWRGCPQYGSRRRSLCTGILKCIGVYFLYFLIGIGYFLLGVLGFVLYPFAIGLLGPQIYIFSKSNCIEYMDTCPRRTLKIIITLLLFPISFALGIFPGYFCFLKVIDHYDSM